MVLQYSPGFYPFSDPSPGTHSDPSRILARIPHFPGTRLDLSRVLAQIPPFSGTHPYFYFSSTCSDSTPSSILLPVLTRALLGYSLGSHLSRYSPGPFSGTRLDSTFLWYSPIFPLFRHSPGFYPFSDPSPGTHLSPSRILARIVPFPVLARTFLGYSPEFHLSLVLTQISTFPTLTRILPFPDTHLDFYFSSTHPDSTLSRYSPGPFSCTRPDQSLMFCILRFLLGLDPFCIEFSDTRPDRFPFRFGDSLISHSNPLVLMFKIYGIVSRLSYTTSSIVPGSSFFPPVLCLNLLIF